MTTWPATAAIRAEYGLAAQPDVERTAFEDGSIRQARLYTGAVITREITAEIAGAGLAAFRAWAAASAHRYFRFPDPTDGRTYNVRVIGGAGGIEYRQVTSLGGQVWEARMRLEGPPDEVAP